MRKLDLTVRGWHDIGFAAPRLLLHLSRSLPHVEDIVLLDQSAADEDDEYEGLLVGTPPSATAAVSAAAHFASSVLPGTMKG